MTVTLNPQFEYPCTLFVMNDIDAHVEAEFNEWYQTEHVLQRMNLAGFISARRYRALGDSQATGYNAISRRLLRRSPLAGNKQRP